MSLCVISPVRDEQQYARRTLESMVAQTVRPDRWVIVDDGSTDDTPAILAEYAAAHDWITVVRREDRGHRAVGPGVIDAFWLMICIAPYLEHAWAIPHSPSGCASRAMAAGET